MYDIDFHDCKSAKLKRLPALRALNMIGMVAWRNNKTGPIRARHYFRLCHPLTLVWFPVLFGLGIWVEGIPTTINDCKEFFMTLWYGFKY